MIEAAEMKVKHANEIVKYLQLELENYKDAYDIFGPNDVDSLRERLSNKRLSPSIDPKSEAPSSPLRDFSPVKRSFRIKPIQTEVDEDGRHHTEEDRFEPIGVSYSALKQREQPMLPPLKGETTNPR